MDEIFWGTFDTYFTERMGNVLNQNETYKRLIEKESTLLEHLQSGLTEEQAACLEEYCSVVGEVHTQVEKMMYRQGIKDLMEFLIFNK